MGGAARSGSAQTGLRNSLLIAIAPTATIASIAGCYECIEPQVSNLFKRETLSGEFLQVNPLPGGRAEGARAVDRRRSADAIKLADGSVQGVDGAAGGVQAAVPHRLGAAACGR